MKIKRLYWHAPIPIFICCFFLLLLYNGTFAGRHSEASSNDLAPSILPGRMGFGTETPAGSGPNREGGRILHVTNWEDSGPGSLRAALETPGPRIVVFDVSGNIPLRSEIHVTAPYLTIAGQTAPSPGVTLKGAGLTLSTHDVLIQHIRIRVGDDPEGPSPGSRDGIQILNLNNENDVYNIVIDHVSVSWAVDENLSTWFKGIHDISINQCIIGEGLWDSIHPKGAHSKGFLVGEGTHNLSVIGNLFIHNDERNLRALDNTSSMFVNNLIFNWDPGNESGSRSVYNSKKGKILASVVGNAYFAHPSDKAYQISYKNVTAGSKIFLQDNRSSVLSNGRWKSQETHMKKNRSKEADRPPVWIESFKARSAEETPAWVLRHAGARPAERDAVDLRLVADAANGGGGLLNSPKDVGGWPPLARRLRGADGIPSLEIPSGGIQPSGYTKVEEWLHEMARQVENPPEQ